VEASLLEICAEPDLLGSMLKGMTANKGQGPAKAVLLVQTTAKAVAALLQVRLGKS
jgi:hypothetical protein